MKQKSLLLSVLAALALAVAVAVSSIARAAQPRALEAGVDGVFAKWTADTPGCAVGVSVNGASTLERAYGMADLEHGVRNMPQTIFEAGSVSKQFTALAVLLLAREQKLSLDDPARKYLPELPEYGAPLTIRHMLTHTSGLRDWGSVAGIAGWPRTTRVHTHAHVLDIVSRQRALNFTPGTRWSYSNTGYNLAAIIVSRVSGMPFAEFTKTRIFEPLGMTRTSWRDDHTRVVKGRAIAYSEERDGFHTEMPFENVHGNGGLLTTVGDLLRWNENFAAPRAGDAALVRAQQEPGRFSDGRSHDYALGLRVGQYKGVREVSHSGSTAGYRAYLARYPNQRVSVAVLCNASSADAGRAAHAVADLYLKDHLNDRAPIGQSYKPSSGELEALSGIYKNTETGEPMTLVRDGERLRLERGGALVALSGTRLTTADASQTFEVGRDSRVRVTDEFGTVDTFERVEHASPTPEQLRTLAGTYVSDEAEVTVRVDVEPDSLVVKRRPDATLKLTPVYADAFRGSIGLVRFHRDRGGRVAELSVQQDRVWDLRFRRQAEATSSQ